MTKTRMFACYAFAALAAVIAQAQVSAVTVTIGPSTDPWNGYMNVSELPANGGGFVFGGSWGVADLVATFDDPGQKVTLSPNTIGDVNEFWYQDTCNCAADPVNPGGPGQAGNKSMEANLYIEETGLLAGQTVDFIFNVLSDTTTAAHAGFAFIKDFAADYSSSVDTVVALAGGPQTISLGTINDPARHVQYGFQFVGENVWITDTAPFGSIVIGAIPEPGTFLLAGLGVIGMFGGYRRRG